MTESSLQVLQDMSLRFACAGILKLRCYTFQRHNNKGPDQTVWMCRVACTFAGMQHRPEDKGAQLNIFFSISHPKHFVVGTQKNLLNFTLKHFASLTHTVFTCLLVSCPIYHSISPFFYSVKTTKLLDIATPLNGWEIRREFGLQFYRWHRWSF